jgi:hypothetical protein
MDQRQEFLRNQLNKLTSLQIQRIIDSDGVVFDTVNYDSETDRWCPIGVAFQIKNKPISQEEAIRIIEQHGFDFKTVKGIPGNFYTTNREEDLKLLCQEIIDERILSGY